MADGETREEALRESQGALQSCTCLRRCRVSQFLLHGIRDYNFPKQTGQQIDMAND